MNRDEDEDVRVKLDRCTCRYSKGAQTQKIKRAVQMYNENVIADVHIMHVQMQMRLHWFKQRRSYDVQCYDTDSSVN